MQTTALDTHLFYKLSRFVMIRPAEIGFVIETPHHSQTAVLENSDIFKILCVFSQPVRLEDVLASLGVHERELVLTVVERCVTFGILESLTESCDSQRDALLAWEPHDIYFHTRSRLGRHANPSGATYRLGDLEPEPQPELPVLAYIHLPSIDLGSWQQPRLTDILAQRRSIRRWSDSPLSLKQLGLFLFLSAGQQVASASPTQRPYPSAGGLYPLTIYLTVRTCQDLEAGIYRYDPIGHGLARVAVASDQSNQLLEDARLASAAASPPPILIHLSACFIKTSWKYSSIAYGLILKEVGCLMQNFYLVASALELAACALGNGNSDLFSQAIGSDYFRESSVGELMLGPKPQTTKHEV